MLLPHLGVSSLTNDPYFNNVSLLLSARDGLIKDYSRNNHEITVNGNTTIASNYAMFGDKSIYFDGSDDYLSIPTGDTTAFGTSDFSIEIWLYPTRVPTTNWTPIIAIGYGSFTVQGHEIRIGQNVNGSGLGYLIPNNTNNGNYYIGYGALTLNQSHYIALIKKGSVITLYKNGVPVGSTSSVSFNFGNYGNTLIGFGFYADGYFCGYINMCRITKGIARPIQVPTQPFPDW